MTFSFSCTLTKAEQVRASRIITTRQPAARLIVRLAYLLVASGLVYMAVSMLFNRPVFWPVVVAPFGGLAGVYAFVYLGARSMVDQIRDKSLSAEGTLMFNLTDAGLEVCGTGSRTSLEWQNIVELLETKDFLLFYVSKGNAIVLPRRIISEGEFSPLREALRTWVGEKARLSGPPVPERARES